MPCSNAAKKGDHKKTGQVAAGEIKIVAQWHSRWLNRWWRDFSDVHMTLSYFGVGGYRPPSAEAIMYIWHDAHNASEVTILWCNKTAVHITRPHCSTTHVHAAYCYRLSSVVCHDREPCNNGWTNPDAVWGVDLGGSKNHDPKIRVQIPSWECTFCCL